MTLNDPYNQEETANEFNLTCKVVVKKLGYIDEQSDGIKVNREGNFVFLIPQESSEMYRFLSAWLPYGENEHTEVAMKLGHPLNCNARGAVMRANKRCEKHHIQLMTYGLIQLISDTPSLQNRTFELSTYPDHMDNMADKVVFDGELPFEKKKYDEISEDDAINSALG